MHQSNVATTPGSSIMCAATNVKGSRHFPPSVCHYYEICWVNFMGKNIVLNLKCCLLRLEPKLWEIRWTPTIKTVSSDVSILFSRQLFLTKTSWKWINWTRVGGLKFLSFDPPLVSVQQTQMHWHDVIQFQWLETFAIVGCFIWFFKVVAVSLGSDRAGITWVEGGIVLGSENQISLIS